MRICACDSGPRMNVRNLRAHFGSPSVRSLRDLIYFHIYIYSYSTSQIYVYQLYLRILVSAFALRGSRF